MNRLPPTPGQQPGRQPERATRPPPGMTPSLRNGYLVVQDGSDTWLWRQVGSALPKLDELREAGETARPSSGSLVRDLFALLFKARPVLRQPRTPSQEVRHRILTSVLESPEYRRLRATTRLRALPAAEAAAEVFARLLADWPAELDPGQAPGQPQGTPCPAQGASGSPTASPPAAQQASDRLDTLVRQLLRAAAARAEEVVACVEGWGTAPGNGAGASLADAAALAQRVQQSDLLRRIALMAGRIKRLAVSKHRLRVRHGTDEVVSIETGRDLSRVLPQELVALRHPVLRREFLRRFAEGSLLQVQLEGREALGQGPMIVCLDSSGSMAGAREAWAKAVALALLHVAAQERRDYALVHFGSRDELRVFRFGRGHATAEQVVEALGFAFHGGTDFEAPLRQAMDLVLTSTFVRADVVFLTDGECQLSSPALAEVLATKARRQVRIFSVLIDLPDGSSGSPSDRSLRQFSDEVCRLTDLAQDAGVLEGLFGRS